ncbi:serine hydrolase [Streptomyces fradiae]|uniref:serine hydrolase domain-containing protein n=1 Tax=Streptomyces fradiae TaxID=1906 RepID=UPI003987C923
MPSRALDDVRPLGPPGTTYAYTSANYLVLAALVESVTGRPFADHLRDSVLRPAGMDGAIADRASARARNLPPGHQLLWGVPSAIADGVDDDGAAYGYAGGDLNDLTAFASLQLRSGKTAGGGMVLTPESVRLMRQPGRLHPSGAATGYGLGWRVGGLEPPLDTAVWHTGATPGYSAVIFLLPDQDLALVLQQNLHGLLHDGAVMQAASARPASSPEAPPTGPPPPRPTTPRSGALPPWPSSSSRRPPIRSACSVAGVRAAASSPPSCGASPAPAPWPFWWRRSPSSAPGHCGPGRPTRSRPCARRPRPEASSSP